ncbi:DNA-processing protein DprA [Candidatus Babeliales bacterium]|nr:DNA-processing protein DprA [Candidatus Babeliales bacterium]
MISKYSKLALHLTLIDGVGPVCIEKIFNHCGILNCDDTGACLVEDIYRFSAHDFVHRAWISLEKAQLCVKGLQNQRLLEEELELIHNSPGVSIVTVFDDDYPELLAQINRPPTVLWVQGKNIGLPAQRLAVVGARRATDYAQDAIYRILPEVVSSGWNIVSGGALGVDSLAHECALDFGGTTTVILGSGILNLYPVGNKRLFNRVVEQGGSLVSPFSLRFAPIKGNFPARNRIIAGLSEGCVVVQAGRKSGALITASYALEEGREVWAVPGNIDCEMSEGPHKLLRNGACIAAHPDDILSVLRGECPRPGQKNIRECSGKVVQKQEIQVNALDTLEAKILTQLKCAQSLDDLVLGTEQKPDDLMEKLFEMQLLGKVQQNYVGMWERA